MNTNVIKINSTIIEEILWRGVKNQLRVKHDKVHNWRITCSDLSESFDPNVLEKRIIYINHIGIKVLTYKTYKKGYMHHFYYTCKETKYEINNRLIQFEIYVPFDYVDDGVNFFTLNGIEIRRLKINQLNEKFEKRLKKV